MSANVSNISDITPRQSAEVYGALNGIDTKINYSSRSGGLQELQGLGSLPIESWNQNFPATGFTPHGYPTLTNPLSNATSCKNYDSFYASRPTTKPENFGASWENNAPSVSSAIGGVNASSCISQQHLNNCYAYALDRGHGQYTQLIPADCLPMLLGLPSVQGPEGLIILSPPRGPVPSNVSYNIESPFFGSTQSPPSQSGDVVQNTIDSIVANQPRAPKKREKVYCDKWLHEGVCAFAQQGCRYKHEMPMDKATQHAVGLFNGLPKWYKEKHALELRARSPPSSFRNQSSSYGPRNALVSGGSWRGGGGIGHVDRGCGVLPSSSFTPKNTYKPRGTGPTMSPSGRNGNGVHSTKPNERPRSGVSSGASSNLYVLLSEQDETEIDDREV